jgi:hypothetical protein
MARIRIASSILLAVLSGTSAIGQTPTKIASGDLSFADNRCFSKGGIGIITTHLYIDLKSPKNELRLAQDKRWIGKDAAQFEVVVFFSNKVWSPHTVPRGFDLSHAIVVWFERDKVRFFDFGKMSGGYYLRLTPDS